MNCKLDKENTEKLAKLNALTSGKYKAFLYDCDGTLADNMGAHKAAFVKVAASHSIDLDDSIIDELAGWPTVLVVEEICKRYAVTLDITDFAQSKSKLFVEEFISDTLPIPFVVEHLRSHASEIKIGVVSGGSRSTVTKTISILGIDHLIEVLVCAGETPHGKPFPDPFLYAAGQLGVDPKDCIVFEDGEPGVQAAIKAGMDWIRVDQL